MPGNGLVITSGHRESTALIVRGSDLIGPFSTTPLNHHAALYPDLVMGYTRILGQCARAFDCRSIEHLSDAADFILLCLPGAATPFDKQIALSLLVRCGWKDSDIQKAYVVDDTWAGAVAASDKSGVIYGIADSGSSVFVFTGDFPVGRAAKFDGWGALMGDHGSSFQLALDSLRLICRELDRGRNPGLLAALQEYDEELATLSDLQLWFDNLLNRGHTVWRQKVADLAVPVLQAADQIPGDYPDALRLVQSAASAFADTLDVSVRSFVPDSHGMDIVVGGRMMACRVFRNRLEFEVERRLSKVLRPSELTIMAGALLMAASLPTKVPSPDTRSKLIRVFEGASERIVQILYEPWSQRRSVP